jgi:hypothetical protein
MNEQVQALRTGDDSTDKLRECPGTETDATRDDTPFASVPGQWAKLLNPKSLGGLHAMGRLPALERGLRTNPNRSLAVEEPITDSSVTFDEAVITALRAELFEAGPLENYEGTSNHDRPLKLYPMNISQLIRTTNDRMALILLTASAVFVLALECFHSVQLHPGEEQERIESDREAAKPTYGTIFDRIDVPTTSTMNPPWMRIASSVRCPADSVLERLVPETIESTAATAVFFIFVVTAASNLARIVYAIAMVRSRFSQYRMSYAGYL